LEKSFKVDHDSRFAFKVCKSKWFHWFQFQSIKGSILV
jgi:hypothetical protein